MDANPVQTVKITAGKMLGETFADELKAAAPALYQRVNGSTPPFPSEQLFAPTLTDTELAKLNQIIAAHDPAKKALKFLPLELIRQRAEAEAVNGSSAWDKLVDWVLIIPPVQARRDVFTRFMWKRNPIPQNSTAVRDWFTSAGVPPAVIERIFADPDV